MPKKTPRKTDRKIDLFRAMRIADRIDLPRGTSAFLEMIKKIKQELCEKQCQRAKVTCMLKPMCGSERRLLDMYLITGETAPKFCYGLRVKKFVKDFEGKEKEKEKESFQTDSYVLLEDFFKITTGKAKAINFASLSPKILKTAFKEIPFVDYGAVPDFFLVLVKDIPFLLDTHLCFVNPLGKEIETVQELKGFVEIFTKDKLEVSIEDFEEPGFGKLRIGVPGVKSRAEDKEISEFLLSSDLIVGYTENEILAEVALYEGANYTTINELCELFNIIIQIRENLPVSVEKKAIKSQTAS